MSFLNNLFGTSVQAPQVQAQIAGFNGGGLTGGFSGNSFNVSPTADRSAAVGGVSSTFGGQAADIGNLRSQFAPGASQMLQTQLTALNNNRTQSLGNLSQNLAQRRVLGSSFAQNSLANADQSYQQQIAQTTAQSYLQELSVQSQLSQQQWTAARGQFQTNLDEMNLEAGVATQLTSQATSAMTSAAQTQAQLDLQAQTTNANNTMKMLGGLGSLAGFALGGFGGLGSLGGFLGASSPSFGGGSAFTGDAYGGSSSNPLPGLTAADYGSGF